MYLFLCVCVGACRLTYPVYDAQAPYCLRPLWLDHIFRHYLETGTIFGQKSLNIKCVFWFSLEFLFKTFLIRRINQRYIINEKTSSCKVVVILSDFNKIWIFSTDFRKTLKCQISSKSVHWEPSCSMRTNRQMDGWTDGHEANSRFSQFCERAWKYSD